IGEKYLEVCQKNYPAALDRWVAISQRYGFSPAIRKSEGCRYAKIYSKPLIEYLQIRFGVTGRKDKEIPQWFLSLPRTLCREFLKTFIALESSLRDNRVVFTQKSRRNVNIIAYMLLREGIRSWIRKDADQNRKIYRLKIQGSDLPQYLQTVGWLSDDWKQRINCERTIRSSFCIVPVDRRRILRLVELLGLNSFHTLEGRKPFVRRSWYGSYKGIKEGETVMAVDALRKMVDDLQNEITLRKSADFIGLRESEPRRFAAGIGLPITRIAEGLAVSKNQVWQYYETGVCTAQLQITNFLQDQYSQRMAEVEALLRYCEQLLSEDVFYDPIKSISYGPSAGMAFGLTVPGLQNYLGGFGACGINHNTYPLPEAQADRFLLKILTDYPSFEDELRIVDQYSLSSEPPQLPVLLNKKTLFALQALVRQVPLANDLKQRIVRMVTSTRKREGTMFEYGASPRASIGLVLACKARALMEGRNYVSTKDIETMVFPVLRHRVILNFEAQRKGMIADDGIRDVLAKVKQ
ncbi:MAG: hypothetical protein HY422_01300, partial [Candidatus Komeilibacteria bacterium]|nr:hypothetical protein [Candidatus Komeilibacteria bacterium]